MVRQGYTGVYRGTIQGDNSTGPCFVLKKLIQMKCFKQIIIMKLKMCTTGKTFGKICLKAPRDAFFQCVICNEVRGKVNHEGKGDDSIS